MRSAKNKLIFRPHLVAYHDLIWKELIDIFPHYHKLRLFKEIAPRKSHSEWTAITWQQPSKLGTIVTPYIAQVFKSIYFAKTFQMVRPSLEVHSAHVARATALGFLPLETFTKSGIIENKHFVPRQINHLKIGQVVALARDDSSSWGDSAASWYGYVHQIKEEADQTLLRVLWLYAAEHTVLGDCGLSIPQ